ncbi:MAG TPA: chromate resistance protein ChrB domain-containing protein [Polyangia bacterium]
MVRADSSPPSPRWLLLIHQLPPSPAYLRVKTARQLQKIGAVAVKNSVYVLPNGERGLETFAWLAKEIAAGGGEATVCESSFVGGTSNEAVEAMFHAARAKDYRELAAETREAQKGLGVGRRLDEDRRSTLEATLVRLRRRLGEIGELDFFGTPDGETTASLIDGLELRLRRPAGETSIDVPGAPLRVKGGVWVTRKGVHVDRIASAWLIKRFIDREANLKFVTSKGYLPRAGELRFDMFEAEYTHEGNLCTFEVLARKFAVSDAAVSAIGEVVHDIDVRDGRFGRAETAGIERLVNGIALTQPDDDARIALGGQLFDALYETWRRKRT